MNKPLPNTAFPTKIYGIFCGHKQLGEVQADNVHDALLEGRRLWPTCTCAIWTGNTQREPRFLR